MSKLFVPALSFVCVMGGLALLFTEQANIANVALLLGAFTVIVSLGFYAYKHLRPLKTTKIIIAVWSVISCAISLTVAARLVVSANVIDSDFYPLTVLLTGALAAAVALSRQSAVKSVTLISALAAFFAFVIIIVLSLLDTDFSMPRPVPIDIKALFPVGILAIFDVLLLFDVSDSKTPVPLVLGGAAAFALMLTVIFVSLCVLSPDIYYSLDAPLLKLWQSTYITSFVNRFEVVAVSFLYLLTALKSGLVLYPAVKTAGRKFCSLIMLFAFALCSLFSFL